LDRFNQNNVFATSDGRFFVLILIFQTTSIFLNTLVPIHIISLSIVLIFCIFMLLCILRFLPFYNFYVNVAYGISFCFNVGFSLTGIISEAKIDSLQGDNSSLFFFSIVVLVVLFSILIVVRLFILHQKIKHTIEIIEEDTKKEKFDLFRSSIDVDIEAHYAMKKFDLKKAEIIYTNAIKLNSNSSRIKIFYLLFLFENESLDHEYMRKLNATTRELVQKKSFWQLFDTRYLIHVCCQKRVEASLKHNLGILNGNTVLQLRRAKKSKSSLFYWTHEFWKIIQSEKFEYYRLLTVFSSMEYYEKKCDFIYESLIKENPLNVTILRSYADYLETVKLKFHDASYMFEQAKKYEENPSNHAKEVKTSMIDIIKKKWINQFKKRNSHENLQSEATKHEKEETEIKIQDPIFSIELIPDYLIQGLQNREDNSDCSRTETVTVDETQESKVNELEDALFDEFDGLKDRLTSTEKNYYQFSMKKIQEQLPIAFWIFGIILVTIFCIFMFTICISYFTINSKLERIEFLGPLLNKAGKCRLSCASLAYYSRMVQLNISNSNISYSNEMIKFSSFLGETTQMLYRQSLRSTDVYPIWKDDSLLRIRLLDGSIKYHNLMDSHLMIISKTKKFLNSSNEEDFHFLNMNGALELPYAYNELIVAIKKDEIVGNNTLFLYCGIFVFIFVLSALLLIFFIPWLYWNEKNHIALFYQASKEEIDKIIVKYKNLFEKESDKTIESSKVNSKPPILLILIRNIVLILIFGITLLCSFLILFSISREIVIENIQNVDFSGRRRFITSQIMLRTTEISTNQSYLSLNENKFHLDRLMNRLNYIDRSLRMGGSLGLKGSDGKMAELDALYYLPRCQNTTDLKCLSLFEIFLRMNEQVNKFLNTTGSTDYLNQLYEEILPLWDQSVKMYSMQNRNIVRLLSTANQVIFIFGISTFMFLFFFLMLFAPFSLKDQILRTKSLFLNFSIDQIFKSKGIEKEIHGANIDASYQLETKHHQILNNHKEGIIEFSDSLLIDYVNSVACKFFGIPYNVLIGTELSRIFNQTIMKEIQNYISSEEMKFSKEFLFSSKKIRLTIIRLKSGIQDEFIGQMDDLTEIEVQKDLTKTEVEKSNEIYLNSFPKLISQNKIQNGNVNFDKYYESCTILVCNFINMEELFNQLNEVNFFNFLNEIYEVFFNLCEKYEVELLKLSNSSFVVVSGVPKEFVDHAFSILDFTLELKEVLEEFSDKFEEKIEMKYSVHSGSVIGGILNKKKFSFDVFGETVSNVHLLNEYSKPGMILVSDTSHLMTEEYYEFRMNEEDLLFLPKSYFLLCRKKKKFLS
jgi:class 3 adenylate cyclase/PAS domain-containing protein